MEASNSVSVAPISQAMTISADDTGLAGGMAYSAMMYDDASNAEESQRSVSRTGAERYTMPISSPWSLSAVACEYDSATVSIYGSMGPPASSSAALKAAAAAPGSSPRAPSPRANTAA